MKFQGTVEIAAPRDKVWAFVVDPDQVGIVRAGRRVDRSIDETTSRRRPRSASGSSPPASTATWRSPSRSAPDKVVIKAHGQAPGRAVDAMATMALRDGADGGTAMDWSADVTIAGTLASVGARLIEGTANKLTAQTFTCIKAKLEAAS